MRRRTSITLPEKTIQLLDCVAGHGNRSRFIDEAVKKYGRAVLRKQIKESAIRDAKQDLAIAEEWFPLEEEVWPD